MILFGNINKGLEEYHSTSGAILVDVRGQAAVSLLSAWDPEQTGSWDSEENGIHCEEYRRY